MGGIYNSPRALVHAELAALAHAAWVVVPLTLAFGVWALVRFLRRDPAGWGRYLHGGMVLLLWLVYLSALYYLRTGANAAYVRPRPGWGLAAAGVALLGATAVGLVLRHVPQSAGRTARTILLHWLFAAATSVFVITGLWPYR